MTESNYKESTVVDDAFSMYITSELEKQERDRQLMQGSRKCS